jgi:hypothetical protein
LEKKSRENFPNYDKRESIAVQSYLTALQGVITRMATNSSNCKTLCVTIVAAILVVVSDKSKTSKSKTSFTFVALFPILILCFLDAYYLGLEQGFRCTYNDFVAKLRDGKATVRDLYVIVPKNKIYPQDKFNPVMAAAQGFSSFSVYPFYSTLTAILLLGYFFVFKH